MTEDQILDGILEREGPGVPPDYRDPADAGGRTAWGVSERAHPEAWRSGPPTREQARAIYAEAYVAPWDWLRDAGADDRLRAQCIDFGVTSGVGTATRALQRVLGVPDDGAPGPLTQGAATHAAWRHVNNELVAERIKLEEADIAARAGDRRFEHGWVVRTLSFYWPKEA